MSSASAFAIGGGVLGAGAAGSVRIQAPPMAANSPVGPTRSNRPAEQRLPPNGDLKPAEALDRALRGIAARYGMPTADFVAMQLEIPRHSAPN